jgi:hypothetical protein
MWHSCVCYIGQRPWTLCAYSVHSICLYHHGQQDIFTKCNIPLNYTVFPLKEHLYKSSVAARNVTAPFPNHFRFCVRLGATSNKSHFNPETDWTWRLKIRTNDIGLRTVRCLTHADVNATEREGHASVMLEEVLEPRMINFAFKHRCAQYITENLRYMYRYVKLLGGQWQVDSKGFWWWCTTLGITRFLDSVNRPVF